MSNYRNKTLEHWALIFDALSNPNRLKLWLRLLDGCCLEGEVNGDSGTCSCIGELADGLDLAPSTVSHHIKELRRAGLIKSRRRGQRSECWIDTEILKALAEFFDPTESGPLVILSELKIARSVSTAGGKKRAAKTT